MSAITKKQRPNPEIPSASMSDIAFLLLIFFMVSTVFVKEKGLKLTLPKAENISKVPRDHTVTIYVDKGGKISIDDFKTPLDNIFPKMQKKKSNDPSLITSFRTDKNTKYKHMSDIMSQMRDAEALRVSFEAKQRR